jgi:hypothetical protein
MKKTCSKKFLLTSFAILTLLSSGFFCPKPAKAEDENPPQIIDLSLSKTEINTQTGSDTVKMTLHITDDISGLCIMSDDCPPNITYLQALINPYDGNHFGTQSAHFLEFTRVGTPQNGIYEATATFPHQSKEGSGR